MRADIQDDARLILLRRVYRLAFIEIARGEFQHERIGGIAQARPVEYCTIGCREETREPRDVLLSGYGSLKGLAGVAKVLAGVINVVSETAEASRLAFVTNSRRELRFSVVTLAPNEG